MLTQKTVKTKLYCVLICTIRGNDLWMKEDFCCSLLEERTCSEFPRHHACPSLSLISAGRLSISTSLLSLTAITYQALPTRHQVTDRQTHAQTLTECCVSASELSSQESLLASIHLGWSWCWAEGTWEMLTAESGLLEKVRTWSLLLQLHPCCHAAFLNRVSSAAMVGSKLRPCGSEVGPAVRSSGATARTLLNISKKEQPGPL